MSPTGSRLVTAALAVTAWTATAAAHVMSVSHGELQVSSNSVRYELRMPLLEVPEGPDREKALLDAFDVRVDGEAAVRTDTGCKAEPGQGVLACGASFAFQQAPEIVSVRCDFPAVVVPNHIHILRSGEGDVARQTVFDITVREAEIRFTPPTRAEILATALVAGIRRAATSPEMVLFLVALACAARSRKELLACAAAFVGAQASVAAVAAASGWAPPARFLEAAAALTVAYVASEVLFLPESSGRWAVCGAMGCIHGLFLASFLQAAKMEPLYYLPGALGAEALLAGGLGAVRLRFARQRGVQLAGLLLLVGGLCWFGLRLID